MAELGLQAAFLPTSLDGAIPNALLDHEELKPDGQTAHNNVTAKTSQKLNGNTVIDAEGCITEQRQA